MKINTFIIWAATIDHFTAFCDILKGRKPSSVISKRRLELTFQLRRPCLTPSGLIIHKPLSLQGLLYPHFEATTWLPFKMAQLGNGHCHITIHL
jgi:hypothetical protein